MYHKRFSHKVIVFDVHDCRNLYLFAFRLSFELNLRLIEIPEKNEVHILCILSGKQYFAV